MRSFSFILASMSLIFSDIYDGYLLFTPGGGGGGTQSSETRLIDNDNNIINTWSHTNGPASMPYLMPGSDSGIDNSLLYYPSRSDSPTMESGGVGGKVEIYSYTGVRLWNYELSNTIYQHHHDIEPMKNGNILLIAWERLYSNDWEDLGRSSVNNSLNQMWSTAIFEIRPNLDDGSHEIVWEWHIKDHLVQDRGSQYSSTYGSPEDHPELMDVNCGNVGSSGGPGGQANGDWMHINAIDYNENLDQIVMSSRFQDEIYIIDHSTTTEEAASHEGGNSGMGGDFIYRWGNPSNYNRGNSSNEILGDQHGVNWIPDGYPGGGNLILYNNKHTNNTASVLEIQTPINNDGMYDLSDGQPYGPESWKWIHGPSSSFQTQMQGGAFRLSNGNTLITDADDADVIEVDEDGNTQWSYSYSGGNAMIARSQKYGLDFFDVEDYLLGDINSDGIINILDIVQLVNIVLGSVDSTPAADMNGDGITNILDVVQLVNAVLGE